MSKAPVEPQSDFVLDFLYQDGRRIGSFLAQFEDAGHLQQVKEGDAESHVQRRGFGAKAGLKLPNFTGMPTDHGEASIGFKVDPEGAGTRTGERIYDPYWTNARTFLDYAEDKGLIKRGLHNAGIGNIVLLSGALSVLDLKMLRAAYESPAIVSSLASATNPDGTPVQAALVLEALKLLPHTVQASIKWPTGGAWMTLDEGNMVVNASDLLLKHGVEIAGAWTIVGVLDALPDAGGGLNLELNALANQNWVAAAAISGTNMVGLIATMLAPAARFVAGRPGASYGVTPLLIYRTLSSESDAQ